MRVQDARAVVVVPDGLEFTLVYRCRRSIDETFIDGSLNVIVFADLVERALAPGAKDRQIVDRATQRGVENAGSFVAFGEQGHFVSLEVDQDSVECDARAHALRQTLDDVRTVDDELLPL